MAQTITIFGAMLGFIGAIVGFFAFDLSFLSAFVLWALAGPVSAFVGFAVSGTDNTKMPARAGHGFADAA